MLETIAVILIVLWLLGLVSSYTMGGFVHILLVIAIVVILIRVIQGGRRAWDDSSGFLCGRRYEVSAMKLSGIVLIACGISGLAYGGFDYTQDTHEAKIATLELPLTDDEAVDPVWAGIGAIMVGGIVLLAPKQS